MKKTKDRSSRKCVNPWFRFLAIFCVAGFTLSMIFAEDSNRINFGFFKGLSKDDSDDNILIAASGVNLDSFVAAQFETCRNFLVVNESTGKYDCFSNNPASVNTSTLRDFVNRQNIETVIAGTMGIDTYQLLSSLNIEVCTGVTGTVEEALKKHKKNNLVSYSRYFKNKNKPGNTTGNIKSLRREF